MGRGMDSRMWRLALLFSMGMTLVQSKPPSFGFFIPPDLYFPSTTKFCLHFQQELQEYEQISVDLKTSTGSVPLYTVPPNSPSWQCPSFQVPEPAGATEKATIIIQGQEIGGKKIEFGSKDVTLRKKNTGTFIQSDKAVYTRGQTAGEVCYDQLGCFSDSPPYSFTLERPISRHPWPPEVINTRFLLFTRETPKHFQVISALNVSSVLETKFDPSRKSHFIIHGFLEAGEKAWLPDMCRTLLQVSDLNCFIVDWSGGSMAMYTQAANNVHVVGAEVAYFIDYLRDHYSHPLSSIYLIGHSLGAHVAGEAGKRCPGIARISGLDPAGPYFAHTPPEVRLDPSDAVLVDIIHTDGPPSIDKFGLGGFGMSQLVGHLDFFANGGKEQPGCAKSYLRLGDLDDVIDGIEEKILCSHQRSVALFTQSILFPNGFVGYPGPSYRDFQEGAGFPCNNGSCALMGYYADSYTKNPTNEVFFLNTGDVENLLRWRYRVMLTITGSMFVMGSFSVSLCGKVGCSPQYIVHSGFIHSGKSYSALIDVEMDIHPVIQVEFIWHKEAIYVIQATLGATTIAVEHGPSRATYLFCGDEVTKEGIQQKLDPCTIF